jgi:hypothetical protein
VIRLITVYVLSIAGIFLQLDFLDTGGAIAVRLILTVLVSILMFGIGRELYFKKEASPELTETSVAAADHFKPNDPSFFDIQTAPLTELLDSDPKYIDILKRQFAILWNFTSPQNGYLILKNKYGRPFMIHRNILPDIAWDWQGEPIAILTLVDQKNGILIENNLSPDASLLPFYRDDFQPKSMLCLVSQIDSGERLYWIFDAGTVDFFNLQELKALEMIHQNSLSLLESALLEQGIHQAYQGQRNKLDMANLLNTAQNINECLEMFCEILVQEFEASKLTIAFKKDLSLDATTAIVQKSIGIDDQIKRGFEFNLEDGLNGLVILRNKWYLLEDIEHKSDRNLFVPRFSQKENSNYGLRSFISVPIQVELRGLGMITLEHVEPKKYTAKQKDQLVEYSNVFAFAIQRFRGYEK